MLAFSGESNRFNKDPRYANQVTFAVEPTADSFALVASTVHAAERAVYNAEKIHNPQPFFE